MLPLTEKNEKAYLVHIFFCLHQWQNSHYFFKQGAWCIAKTCTCSLCFSALKSHSSCTTFCQAFNEQLSASVQGYDNAKNVEQVRTSVCKIKVIRTRVSVLQNTLALLAFQTYQGIRARITLHLQLGTWLNKLMICEIWNIQHDTSVGQKKISEK